MPKAATARNTRRDGQGADRGLGRVGAAGRLDAEEGRAISWSTRPAISSSAALTATAASPAARSSSILMAAMRRMAAALSPARTRPRSTARPPMPRAIWPRTWSPPALPKAAPSRSPMRSASPIRCRSMSTRTAPARSTRRSCKSCSGAVPAAPDQHSPRAQAQPADLSPHLRLRPFRPCAGKGRRLLLGADRPRRRAAPQLQLRPGRRFSSDISICHSNTPEPKRLGGVFVWAPEAGEAIDPSRRIRRNTQGKGELVTV